MGNLVSISDSSTLIGTDQPPTLHAPELEAGVGCDFDSYLLVPDNALDDRIAAAKARLGEDVVILGHHYQRDEVIKFADFRGDSLKLSFQAAQAEGRYIVFCGVHFMAESADILRREHQMVVLPDLNAGCSMADMADIGQVEACWSELSSLLDSREIIPVTYMNSTAAIKAFTGERGGSVCTSSNAAAVMNWAFETGEKVLFLPDEHLGRNTGYRMGIPLEQMIVWDPYQEFGGNTPEAIRNARVILWKGYCSVHQRFTPQQVERVRRQHPGIRVIPSRVPLRGVPGRRCNRLHRRHHQSNRGFSRWHGVGCRHGNPPRQPPRQGIEEPQSDLARSQRLRLHHHVSYHPAASPLGARKPRRRQRREPHFR